MPFVGKDYLKFEYINISSFFGKIILARLEKLTDLEIIVNEKFIKTEISRGKK